MEKGIITFSESIPEKRAVICSRCLCGFTVDRGLAIPIPGDHNDKYGQYCPGSTKVAASYIEAEWA